MSSQIRVHDLVVGENNAFVDLVFTLSAPSDVATSVDWATTNGTAVAEDHLVVARGRDYEDVPPFKGIYSGRATASLEVTVSITRLA